MKSSGGKVFALVLLCGLNALNCFGASYALDAAGPQAGRISHLWWQYLWVTIGVYVLVLIFLLLPLRRRRLQRLSTEADAPMLTPPPQAEHRRAMLVGGLVAVTVAILFFLIVGDFLTARALGSLTNEKNQLVVKITGHQWWWEVQYLDPMPTNIVVSANEIHIPVGRPIELQLQSVDVIHSFWIPNLHGKKDLIPGHPTAIHLQADRAGRFEGQCAEFCGYQHAHMRLIVEAQSADQFQGWLSAQRQAPPLPSGESERKGFTVFMSKTCVMCHSIQGTPANGRVGPDLTHVASRVMLASSSFPNNRGYRGGWILDPQHLKPGAHMPQHNLSPEELNSLLDYLETLK